MKEDYPGQNKHRREQSHANTVTMAAGLGIVALFAGAEGISNLVTGHDIGKSGHAPAEHVMPGHHNAQPGTGTMHTGNGNFHVTQK